MQTSPAMRVPCERRWIGFLAALVACALLLGASCSSPEKPKEAPTPYGVLMTPAVHIQFAVYGLPTPAKDPLAVLRELLSKDYPDLELVEKLPERPLRMLVSAKILTNVREEYLPPDVESLKYFGRGIDAEQAQALQNSHQVFVLDFAHPQAKVWEALQTANVLAEKIARETNGLVWDNGTREIFSPDEWRKRRLDSWTEPVPNVSKHITIHAYQNGEYVRAISLGMSKIGLPDIVVEESAWSDNRVVGHLVNLFAQSLAEGAVIKKPGQFDLRLREIKNCQVRDPQLASLKPNAKGSAQLSLSWGIPQEGDPDNRLIAIMADRYEGNDEHAQQQRLLTDLFGSEDSIVRVKHSDEELQAASRKARGQLPSLRDAFNAGLKPAEYIQVKAPFETPDGGHEWMWVEVTEWKGNRIKGILSNDPFNIPDLHSGQVVEVKQEDVFDYIRKHADGTVEGNTTAEIIRKMQEAGKE